MDISKPCWWRKRPAGIFVRSWVLHSASCSCLVHSNKSPLRAFNIFRVAPLHYDRECQLGDGDTNWKFPRSLCFTSTCLVPLNATINFLLHGTVAFLFVSLLLVHFLFLYFPLLFCLSFFSVCVCVCGGFILTWKESQTETRTGSLKKRKRKEKGENSNPFPKRKETMEARPHFQTGPGRWKFAWKKAAWSRISQLLIKRWSLVSRELPLVFFSVIFF